MPVSLGSKGCFDNLSFTVVQPRAFLFASFKRIPKSLTMFDLPWPAGIELHDSILQTWIIDDN